ncbi:MAG: hypothetical protein WBW41_13185 [Verrucomicrobiia bacterium]
MEFDTSPLIPLPVRGEEETRVHPRSFRRRRGHGGQAVVKVLRLFEPYCGKRVSRGWCVSWLISAAYPGLRHASTRPAGAWENMSGIFPGRCPGLFSVSLSDFQLVSIREIRGKSFRGFMVLKQRMLFVCQNKWGWSRRSNLC